MKPPRPPRFVTLAIMTTITVIFWVFFSVYKILSSQIEPSVGPDILSPLSPTLDTDSLNTIQNSLYFEETEINSLQSIEPEVTTTPTPLPESTGTFDTETTQVTPTIEP